MLHRVTLLALPAAVLALVACHENPAAPDLTARVVSIVPDGGATGVDPQAPVVITFDHPMRAGMEQYAALHEGDVTGPIVPGTRTWSADRTVLTFVPMQPFKALTQYTVHLGGGMRAADGGYVDYGLCVEQHGGQWANQNMMSGGGMMGNGWRHPNGSYGMVFSFTTA
jgi:hypothetical protein